MPDPAQHLSDGLQPPVWQARRLRRPAVPLEALAQLGGNINGPSLIRAPDWLPGKLGEYHLYFAHHHGKHIRLAFADQLEGPWTLWKPGTLRLDQTPCWGHIASPDVHVDADQREIRMYYHGAHSGERRGGPPQSTCLARSSDGLHFASEPEFLGRSYFRLVRRDDHWLAMARGGHLFRSRDGRHPFEPGPNPFAGQRIRHVALRLEGDLLSVFHSSIGAAPEHIQVSHIDLRGDWQDWRPTAPVTLLRPMGAVEGADLPVQPSLVGPSRGPVHQLRDPAYFCEDGREYLLYSFAGECGIGIARLQRLDLAP